MAPVLSFLRPSGLPLFRIVIERSLDLFLSIVVQRFGRRVPFKQELSGAEFVILESRFRKLLRSYPWWANGHLELGFLALRIGEFTSDRHAAARFTATARISAQAVQKLLFPTHLIDGGRKQRLLARSRALEGLVASRLQQFDQCLDILKHLLALNNAQFLPEDLLHLTLETAASAAYILQDWHLASEYIQRIPSEKRSAECTLILRNISLP